MEKYKYTKADAVREVREAILEGEDFDFIRIFLNDLSRAKDITWEENMEIMTDLICGKFGDFDCSVKC